MVWSRLKKQQDNFEMNFDGARMHVGTFVLCSGYGGVDVLHPLRLNLSSRRVFFLHTHIHSEHWHLFIKEASRHVVLFAIMNYDV